MRFYGLSDREVLQMPWSRAMALLSVIPKLQAEEDLHAVTVVAHGTHPGEKGRGLKAFIADLRKRIGFTAVHTADNQDPWEDVITLPIARQTAAEDIEAERARQRQAAERLQAAWLNQRNDAR